MKEMRGYIMELDVIKNKIATKHINKILFCVAMTIIALSLLGILFIRFLPQKYYIGLDGMGIINCTLSIIAIASCGMYYYIYKKKDFFIVTLIYLSFATERTYIAILEHGHGNVDIMNSVLSLMISTYVMRTILLISTVRIKEGNVVNWILENKLKSLFFTVIITVLLMHVETNLFIDFNENVIKSYCVINIVIIISYLAIIYFLSKKLREYTELIYTVIILSISFLTIKRIYKIYFLKSNIQIVYELSTVLAFLGYITLILGLFIEIVIKFNEGEKLKQHLKIFYELTEYNKSSEVVICDENDKVLYANKKTIDWVSHINQTTDKYKFIEHTLRERGVFKDKEIVINKIKKEGIYKKILFSGAKVYSLDIQIIKVDNTRKMTVFTFIDISKEYKTQKKLMMNEYKLSTIAENIKDIIITIDNNGYVIYANNSTLEVLGYNKEEISKMHYTKFLILNDYVDHYLNQEGDSHIRIKHEVKSKSGKVIKMDSLISNMNNEYGENIGKIIVSRDITYKNQINTLKEKYDEIKEYDRIKTEFFSNLSHEVRTPINIIYSSIQLLNNGKNIGTDEFLELYDKYEIVIRQNCYRLLKIVNNLLDITKIDSGFMSLNFQDYNIVELIEEITMSIVPYVKIKNINMVFDTNVEELQIKCDKDKIENIMLNLISNAIKFTEEFGEIYVDVIDETSKVEIKVRDTGIGIPIELRDKIFDRFTQSNRCKAKELEGTGIGLALVKSLVNMHGGQIYLNEKLEKGSEFVIELPKELSNTAKKKNDERKNIKSLNQKLSIELSDIY